MRLLLLRHSFFVAAALLTPLAAGPVPAQTKPPRFLIWVAHTFMGGPKCVQSGPVHHFQPPGFLAEREKLQRAGVKPEREFFRDLATCEACRKCANYHREIYFEIPGDQSAQAEKLGYTRTTAPGAEELNEYENNKVFKPGKKPQEQD